MLRCHRVADAGAARGTRNGALLDDVTKGIWIPTPAPRFAQPFTSDRPKSTPHFRQGPMREAARQRLMAVRARMAHLTALEEIPDPEFKFKS